MKTKIIFGGLLAVSMLAAQVAAADCQADIGEVEAALAAADSGLAESQTSQMTALLDEAKKSLAGGDEAKCQEQITEAKNIGSIE